MLKPLGNDAEGERLHADHSFVAVRAVAHDPGQGGHFGKPTAVVLALQFDCERHAANVPPGPTVRRPPPLSTDPMRKEVVETA